MKNFKLHSKLENSPLMSNLWYNDDLLKEVTLFLSNTNLDEKEQVKLLDLMNEIYIEGSNIL